MKRLIPFAFIALSSLVAVSCGKDDSAVGGGGSTGTNCTAVQCTGTTQQGDRCKNRTTNCSGRCYLH